jgi:selenocysteine lyase/cysteine desulfurase
MTLPDVRPLFDIPDEVAYLNCAYMGPVPTGSLGAGRAAAARKARPWTIGVDDFFTPVEELRGLFADLLHADVEGVAITPSVSYGLATAATNLSLDPGAIVVVLAEQFPSDLYCWRALARRVDGAVHAVPTPGDGDWTAAVLADLDRLGDRVGVVSVPPCHWADGSPLDLAAVGAACRRAGATFVVDSTQWLGGSPFDVGAIGADVVAGATYKWLLGPYSLGFVWLAPHLRDGMPLEHNWIGRAGSDDFASLVGYTDDYRPGARRYDMGEVSNFFLVPVAAASLRLLASWGVEAVSRHAAGLTARIADGAADLGLGVAPPRGRSPHLMGIRLAGTGLDPAALAATLAADDVHVSVRGTSVRVSAHAYNTVDDVDRLLASLASARAGRTR